ncbi:hypothetical protein FOA43_001395 [Brettanomyces nanus]|uniref:DUF1746 domain-containing protein n=1 Tax=Eeniella nana TaxID=13502 RepID=A0A875S480_EENNA|nr:uncharacterized protein FOA43_001395 [Brettanomyces nanus]QPG74074.1 hypothetical protein FOA43_001395 [Brettanomyces nanus]
MRSFVQFVLGHTPNSMTHDLSSSAQIIDNLSIPNRKVLSQKVLRVAAFAALVSVLSHIFLLGGSNLQMGDSFFENKDYQYGHILMAFVGERKFRSWFTSCCYLVSLDLMVTAFQVIVFCVNYSIKFELSEISITEEAGPVEDGVTCENGRKEYDGYQGDVLVYKFEPLKVLDTVRKYTKEEMIDVGAQNVETATNTDFGLPEMPGGFTMRDFNVGNMV